MRQDTHTGEDHDTWAEQRHTREPCVAHRFLSVPARVFKTPTVVTSVTAGMSTAVTALFPPHHHRTRSPHAFFLPLPSLRDVG